LRKLLSAFALAALVAAPGFAAAAEPVRLTDEEMDKVAAGGEMFVFIFTSISVSGGDNISVSVANAVDNSVAQSFAFGSVGDFSF